MGVAVGDYDNDGFEEIYVTAYGGNTLYHNDGNGTFTDVTRKTGVGAGGWSASAGFFDYDNDGKLDLFVTRYLDWSLKTNRYCGEKRPGYRAYCHADNHDGVTNILYHNNGDGTFTDVSERAGIANPRGAPSMVFVASNWHARGSRLHVSYREPKVRYRNLRNGRFEDVSAKAGPAIHAENVARGCAFGDFDNDGDIDVFVNNLDGPPTLLRNDGGTKDNWIMIKCVGTRSNRSGIGSRVKVRSGGRTHSDEVMSGSSYYSQNDLRLHFGLCKARRVESIEIACPSGLKESFKDLVVNRLVVVQEAKGILETRKSEKHS